MTDDSPRSGDQNARPDDPLAALFAQFPPEPVADAGERPSDPPAAVTEVAVAPRGEPDPGADASSPSRLGGRFWRLGFPGLIVLLSIVGIALVWFGVTTILDSSDGQLVKRVTDPSAPGYEAVVEKTPTDLLLSVDASGQLDSITLFARSGPGVGGVMSIPATTQVTIPVSATVAVPITLRAIYASSGSEQTRNAVGELLNLSFTDSQEMRPEQWAALVARVSPLTVNNPTAVVDAKGAVVFPKGSVTVSAAQAWAYLSTLGPRESDLERLVRQQGFLRAMLAAMATGGPDSIPIPIADGLGSHLASLATAKVSYSTLPVRAVAATATVPAHFVLSAESGAIAVAPIVPLPEGAPGRRPRLRVLDGTGELDNGIAAGIALAAGGGQVDVVGNARTFGATTTQFVYFEPDQREAAERMRAVLGVGEVQQSNQTNSATDLTVVLGSDSLDRASTTTDGGPGA